MRLLPGVFVLAAALGLGPPAFGVVYNDTVGDNFDANAHMDLTSVEVTDDGNDITFKISVNSASITSPDWGKYVVGISTSNATGDFGSPVGNPWGRNIRMADGMDAWIGSWVDGGGGFQAWSYSGGSWTENVTGGVSISDNMTSITTSLASLGLLPGQTFQFDVYSTGGGGGDSANDSLANPGQAAGDWQDPYTTPSGEGLFYTTVPEPASIALVGLAMAGLLGLRRRK